MNHIFPSENCPTLDSLIELLASLRVGYWLLACQIPIVKYLEGATILVSGTTTRSGSCKNLSAIGISFLPAFKETGYKTDFGAILLD